MIRRGEVPFVAIRVGRSSDPREVLGLAKDLSIVPALAFAYVCLWEEFILEVGDAMTGRVKGYRADHVAAKLTYPGASRRLIEAMKRAGVLKTQRGTFFHPHWNETITGQYARDRAERRERERLKKRRQREERDRGDVPGESPGQGGDVTPLSPGKTDIKEERNGVGGASRPPFPPPGGGGVAYGRWEWIAKHHRRPTNRTACARYLEAMTAEDWALCRWVLESPGPRGLLSLSGKKRAFRLDSHKFLATQAYLQFLPEWREKLAKPAIAEKVDEKSSERERDEAARAYILALLGDPDVSPIEKARKRKLWLEANPGQVLEEVGA